jgi:hypothetical protein
MLRKIRDERRGGNGKRSENPPSGRPHPWKVHKIAVILHMTGN